MNVSQRSWNPYFRRAEDFAASFWQQWHVRGTSSKPCWQTCCNICGSHLTMENHRRNFQLINKTRKAHAYTITTIEPSHLYNVPICNDIPLDEQSIITEQTHNYGYRFVLTIFPTLLQPATEFPRISSSQACHK